MSEIRGKLPIGARITVRGAHATVRFIGNTRFAPGTWVGLELDEPSGKNDGSVQGVMYFLCPTDHGIFVRPDAIENGSELPGESVETSHRDLRSPIQPEFNDPPVLDPPRPRTRDLSPVRPEFNDLPVLDPPRLRMRGSSPLRSPKRPSTSNSQYEDLSGRYRNASAASRTPSRSPSKGQSRVSSVTHVAASGESANVEILRSKLKVIETKRFEDHKRIIQLQEENRKVFKLQNLVTRLEMKVASMHQESGLLRNQLDQIKSQNSKLTQDLIKSSEAVEEANLDKEMAEEKREAIAMDMESLQSQYDSNIEIVDLLKEENRLLSASADIDISSLHLDQLSRINKLERHNRSLQESLMKLQKLFEAQESVHRDQIQQLQEKIRDSAQLISDRESLVSELEQARSTVSELRLQLDGILGSESMVEDLTEKNMDLQVRIEDLQRSIDELETLKGLNDELEANHSGAVKKLIEEIEFLERDNNDLNGQLTQLSDRNHYLEGAIIKFRDLVSSLELDIELLKAEKLNSTQSLDTRVDTSIIDVQQVSRKAEQLDIKLQAKTIELQLCQLQYQQALENVEILTGFTVLNSNVSKQFLRGITNLFTIDRIGFKVDILIKYLDASMLKDPLPSSDLVFDVDASAHAYKLKKSCSLLSDYFKHCDPGEFASILGQELAHRFDPIDAVMDMELENMKQQIISPSDIISVLSNQANALDQVWDTLDDELKGSTSMITIQLLNEIHHEAKISTHLLSLLADEDTIVNLSRSKTTSKRLEQELNDSNKQLKSGYQIIIANVRDQVHQLRKFLHSVARVFAQSSEEDDINKDAVFTECFKQVYTASPEEGKPFIQLIRAKTEDIYDMISRISLGENELELIPPKKNPWKVRLEELTLQNQHELDREQQFQSLQQELQLAITDVRAKDKTAEELQVKISVLESKMDKSRDHESTIIKFRTTINEGISREKELKKEIKHLQELMNEQETQMAKWKRSLKASVRAASSSGPGQNLSEVNARAVQNELQALRSTIKYLGQINNESTWSDLNLNWLDNIKPPQTPMNREIRTKCIKIFHNLRAIASDIDYISLERHSGWRPIQATPKYVVARQSERLQSIQVQLNGV